MAQKAYLKWIKMKYNVTDIKDFYLHQCDIAINSVEIDWVLTRITQLGKMRERKLTPADLSQVNHQINSVSTGKRKKYHLAKEAVLCYFHERLNWKIPPKIANKFIDKKNAAFDNAEQYKALSECVLNVHNENVAQVLAHKMVDEVADEMGVCIAELLFNTAPLSPVHLSMALHQQGFKFSHAPALLEFDISTRINHSHWVRFELSVKAAILFKRVNKLSELTLSPAKIVSLILGYFQRLTSEKITMRIVNKILRCHWRSNVNDWAVNDLFNVEQQHALSPQRFQQLLLPSSKMITKGSLRTLNLFTNDIIRVDRKNIIARTKTLKPLYLQLLKIYNTKGRQFALNFIAEEKENSLLFCDEQHLVLDFLYEFTTELIIEGGPLVEHLKSSTISTYTSLFNLIKKTVFKYNNDLHDSGINDWADALWEQAAAETQKQKLRRFFQFVYFHPFGEELEISRFGPVNVPIFCDANLVTPREFRQIQHAIESQNTPDFFQFICCYVGVTLAFHGCLRRKELLRLRIQDCEISNKAGDVYRLRITRTKEGSTKSKKTRYVYLSLTQNEQKYLSLLLKLKKDVDPKMPLLGYTSKQVHNKRLIDVPESLFSREYNYLLPITKAIKAICGENVRFHHLRHGGVFLLFCQGRKLFFPDSKAPIIIGNNEPYLTEKHTHLHFYYWIEGREINNLNKNQLLNEIIKMIGHESIQTTRFSYLHGHEWLPSLFEQNTVSISKKELRLLWDLPLQSSELSRKLALLEKKFGEKVHLNPNKHDKSLEIDQQILKVCTQLTTAHWHKNTLIERDEFQSESLAKTVMSAVLQSNNTLWNSIFTEYLRSINAQQNVEITDFTLLSELYFLVGKSASRLTTSNLSLPLVIDVVKQVSNSEDFTMQLPMTTPGIKKMNLLLSEPLFKALKPKISVLLNRKTKPERVLDVIKNLKEVAKFHSKVRMKKINVGNSAFLIKLNIPTDTILLINRCLLKFSLGANNV